MRTGIVASAIIHAMIVAWAVLLPLSTRSWEGVGEEPITVDLVPQAEAAPTPEPPPPVATPEKKQLSLPPAPPETPDSGAANAAQRPALAERQARKQPAQPAQTPAKEPEAPAADKPDEPLATSSWLQQVLEFEKTPRLADLAAMPSEVKPNMPRDKIAAVKAHIMKCWAPPAGVASTPDLKVVIRVALRPTGAIAGEPVLIEATASSAGPALVKSAMRAIQKCQPFDFLPADAYNEWKVLDLRFTAEGMSGV